MTFSVRDDNKHEAIICVTVVVNGISIHIQFICLRSLMTLFVFVCLLFFLFVCFFFSILYKIAVCMRTIA